MMDFKDLGQLVATKAIVDLQSSNGGFDTFVRTCLNRYIHEDWGDLPIEDKKTNDHTLKSGEGRILASYSIPKNATWKVTNSYGGQENKIWIITDNISHQTTQQPS